MANNTFQIFKNNIDNKFGDVTTTIAPQLTCSVTFTSVNYNNRFADVVFFPSNNPNTPIDLGTHQLPYTRTTSDHIAGIYKFYFPSDCSTYSCNVTVNNNNNNNNIATVIICQIHI